MLDDVPLMNKERDDSWESFIKRKDVKAMFSEQGFGFPLNRGYYDLWCIAWAKAWDKGFHEGMNKRKWIGLEKADMPDGEDQMYDHPFFTAGMVWAANKLREKNT